MSFVSSVVDGCYLVAKDCLSSQYTCDDGACISHGSYRCDSVYQCSDL